MRVRFEMASSTGFPTWQAECDMTDKKAHKLFDKLSNDRFCMWAELVSEDDETYMDVLDSFDHPYAREAYRIDQEMKKIAEELFC